MAVLRVKDAAALMIIVSDNIATNMMMDYLGIDRINDCIKQMGFQDTVLHNPKLRPSFYTSCRWELYQQGIRC